MFLLRGHLIDSCTVQQQRLGTFCHSEDMKMSPVYSVAEVLFAVRLKHT